MATVALLMTMFVGVLPVRAQVIYMASAYLIDPYIGYQFYTSGQTASVYAYAENMRVSIDGAEAFQEFHLDYYTALYYDSWDPGKPLEHAFAGEMYIGQTVQADAMGHWEFKSSDGTGILEGSASVPLGTHTARAYSWIFDRDAIQDNAALDSHLFFVLNP
jgi:hypothetical protein